MIKYTERKRSFSTRAFALRLKIHTFAEKKVSVTEINALQPVVSHASFSVG